MNIIKIIKVVVLILLLAFNNSKLSAQDFSNPEASKRGLAIIGDAWHAAAYQYASIVKQMKKKGIKTDIVYNYDVPFDNLDVYDVIVLSRWGLDDVHNFKEDLFLKPEWRNNLWITDEQEKQIEKFVENGGGLFLHHAGHAYYPENGGIRRLAKATHKGHPPRVEIELFPTGNIPELTSGIQPFSIIDEEYEMDFDASATVFLQSKSKENGVFNQGWAHDYGKGKVVVLVPGHDSKSLKNKSVKLLISNVIDYLVK